MDVGLVCDACSALTPIGVPQCTRCGAAVALDPKKQSPPSLAGDATSCHKCGANLLPGQRFCASCGHRIVAPVNFEVETRVGPRSSGTHSVPPTTGIRDKDGKPGRSTL